MATISEIQTQKARDLRIKSIAERDPGVNKLLSDYSVARKQLNDALTELADLRTTVDELPENKKEWTAEKRELKERCETLEAAVAEAYKLNKVMRSDLSRSNIDRNDAQQAAAVAEEQFANAEERIGQLEAEKTELKSQLTELQEHLAAAKDQVSALSAQVAGMQGSKALWEENQELKAELAKFAGEQTEKTEN